MLKIASYLSDCLIVQAYDLEEEKSLPGVLMATEGRVFSILYRLARTDDPAVLAAIRQDSLITFHYFKSVLGIREILVQIRIRIRVSIRLTNNSGSDSFLLSVTFRMQKIIIFFIFFFL